MYVFVIFTKSESMTNKRFFRSLYNTHLN